MRLRPADPAAVAAAWATLGGVQPGAAPPEPVRLLVRHYLAVLARRAPGRSVEVRVPPYGVVQCVAGTRHTRGTPSAVVETDPLTWIALATGRLTWAEAVASGAVQASGERSDLGQWLPLQPEIGTPT